MSFRLQPAAHALLQQMLRIDAMADRCSDAITERCCVQMAPLIVAQPLPQPNTKASSAEAGRRASLMLRQRMTTRLTCYLLLSVVVLQTALYYQVGSLFLSLPPLLLAVLFTAEHRYAGLSCSRRMWVSIALVLLLAAWNAQHRYASSSAAQQAMLLLEEREGIRWKRMCVTVLDSLPFGSAPALHLRVRPAAKRYEVVQIFLRVALHRLHYQVPEKGQVLCGEISLRPLYQIPPSGEALASPGARPAIYSFPGRLLRAGFVLQGEMRRLSPSSEPRRTRPIEQAGIEQRGSEPRRIATPAHGGLPLLERFPGSIGPTMVYAASLGRKDVVATPLWEVFQNLGISHLLVVSGYHIAVLAVVLQKVLRTSLSRSPYLLRRVRVDYLAVLLSILAGWWYFSLIPSEVPVLRAVLASSALVLTMQKTRRLYPGRSMAVVAILVVLLEPAALVDPGPQLTFAALLGLWLGRSLLPAQLQRSWHGLLLSSAVLSLGASLTTAPLVAMYFGLITPLAPLLSLVISPIFSVLLVLVGGSMLIFENCIGVPQLLWSGYFRSIDLFITCVFMLDAGLVRWGLGSWELEGITLLHRCGYLGGVLLAYSVMLYTMMNVLNRNTGRGSSSEQRSSGRRGMQRIRTYTGETGTTGT